MVTSFITFTSCLNISTIDTIFKATYNYYINHQVGFFDAKVRYQTMCTGSVYASIKNHEKYWNVLADT